MKPLSQNIAHEIQVSRDTLLGHRLYRDLGTVEDLALFMEYHVFAVWDFMSLLKSLQVKLTCVQVPWLPVGNAQVRRLVNEIVLGEESDSTPTAEACSHFELYLRSMREAGASTARIEKFIALLQEGQSVSAALDLAEVPDCVGQFVRHTFAVIERGHAHEIASAFTYGREDLIPEMFNRLVSQLERQFPARLSTLRYYLDRHIELDGDEHGELGRQMVELLCADSESKGQQATVAAVAALQSRIALWDGIAQALEKKSSASLS